MGCIQSVSVFPFIYLNIFMCFTPIFSSVNHLKTSQIYFGTHLRGPDPLLETAGLRWLHQGVWQILASLLSGYKEVQLNYFIHKKITWCRLWNITLTLGRERERERENTFYHSYSINLYVTSVLVQWLDEKHQIDLHILPITNTGRDNTVFRDIYYNFFLLKPASSTIIEKKLTCTDFFFLHQLKY